jgi:hypothetical protein
MAVIDLPAGNQFVDALPCAAVVVAVGRLDMLGVDAKLQIVRSEVARRIRLQHVALEVLILKESEAA